MLRPTATHTQEQLYNKEQQIELFERTAAQTRTHSSTGNFRPITSNLAVAGSVVALDGKTASATSHSYLTRVHQIEPLSRPNLLLEILVTSHPNADCVLAPLWGLALAPIRVSWKSNRTLQQGRSPHYAKTDSHRCQKQ